MNYLPTVINIETVNRYCNARCPMCTIKFSPEYSNVSKDEFSHNGILRKAEIMTLDNFKIIIDKFKSIAGNITALNLHGCGEPLLDKSLADKVKYAKISGFTNVGFSSNCDILTRETTESLLDSGLNCLIASIDGLSKDVQEKIRPRTDCKKIYDNVKYFIEYRDKNKLPCRVLPRMVRQQLNMGEWDAYKEYWENILSLDKGDEVLFMDVHNTGGKVEGYDEMKVDGYDLKVDSFHQKKVEESDLVKLLKKDKDKDKDSVFLKVNDAERARLCPDLFSRMNIFASGDVALCAADQSGYYKLGNIIDGDVEEIFNSDIVKEYRNKWLNNQEDQLKYCNGCTITVSRFNKTYKTI